jgi:eukaryotic-like serine/threonine-protein kinase
LILPIHWFALFPLLGVSLQEENIEQAVQCAQHMITPSQQRLPDELTSLLEQAVAAGGNSSQDAAANLLRQALQLAGELRYI